MTDIQITEATLLWAAILQVAPAEMNEGYLWHFWYVSSLYYPLLSLLLESSKARVRTREIVGNGRPQGLFLVWNVSWWCKKIWISIWPSLCNNILDPDIVAILVIKYLSHLSSQTQNTLTHPPVLNRDHQRSYQFRTSRLLIKKSPVYQEQLGLLIFWRHVNYRKQLSPSWKPIRDKERGTG